jgi:hypothetical protein
LSSGAIFRPTLRSVEEYYEKVESIDPNPARRGTSSTPRKTGDSPKNESLRYPLPPGYISTAVVRVKRLSKVFV